MFFPRRSYDRIGNHACGLMSCRAATTAAPLAPELVGLQQDDWPDFVAFFRGASAYVQVRQQRQRTFCLR